MMQMKSGNYDALKWIQTDILSSLDNAVASFKTYVETMPAQPEMLEPCIAQLEQTMHIMDMLSLEGAFLLSQEMLTAAKTLQIEQHQSPQQLQDNLLKGLLLMPNYLKQIGREVSDHPLRLIETINDLRTTLKESRLENKDFFHPNLSVTLPFDIDPQQRKSSKPVIIPKDKISHAFQVHLLNWLKHSNEESLTTISRLIRYIRINCTDETNIILWWAAEGTVEALIDKGLAVDTLSKISIGKLNSSLNLLLEHGEPYLVSHFPRELVQQLLLLVARSNSQGRHVRLIKETFELDFFESHIHQKLYSFTDNPVKEVRSGVLELLNTLKVQIDQFNFDDDLAPEFVTILLDQLSSSTHALEMISEFDASALLKKHLYLFDDSNNRLPTDTELMALAADIVRVEHQLEMTNSDFSPVEQLLHQTAINECINELNDIKEILIQIENKSISTDQALVNVTHKLAVLTGCTAMLTFVELSSLLEETHARLILITTARNVLTEGQLSLFAEIITTSELYLEGLNKVDQDNTLLIQKARAKLKDIDTCQVEALSDNTSKQIPSNITKPESKNDQIAVDVSAQTVKEYQHSASSASLLTDKSVSDKQTGVARYLEQQEVKSKPELNPGAQAEQHSLSQEPVTSETSVARYLKQRQVIPPSALKSGSGTDSAQQPLNQESVMSETGVARYLKQHQVTPISTIDDNKSEVSPYIERPHDRTTVDRQDATKTQPDVSHPEPTEPQSAKPEIVEQPEQATEAKTFRVTGQLPMSTSINHATLVQVGKQQQQEPLNDKTHLSDEPEHSNIASNRSDQIEASEKTIVNWDSLSPQNAINETGVARYLRQLSINTSPVNTSESVAHPPLEIENNSATAIDSITSVHQFAPGIIPEVAEVFVEEAKEILKELDQLIPAWVNNANHEQLVDIRRHYHNLKGSGRVAGAENIGELSWSIENLLNQVIDKQIALDASLTQFVLTSHQLIPELLICFSRGKSSTPELFNQIQNQISAYSPKTVSVPPAKSVEGSQRRELAKIFDSEAQDYLTRFYQTLAKAKAPYLISETLLQTAHALSGAAHSAQAINIARVAEALNTRTTELANAGVRIDTQELEQFKHIIDGLAALLEQSEPSQHQTESLCQKINALATSSTQEQGQIAVRKTLDPEILSLIITEHDEAAEHYQQLRQTVSQVPTNKTSRSLAHSTLTELIESVQLAEIPEVIESYQLIERLTEEVDIASEPISRLIDEGFSLIKEQLNALRRYEKIPSYKDYQQRVSNYLDQNTASIPVGQPEVLQTQSATQDVDEQLLATYIEECAELLGSTDNAIKLWRAEPSGHEPALQLQRDLHTIKGGARLTALIPLADLTHQTESLTLFITEQVSAPDETFFNLLQRCQDRLAELQDQIRQRISMSPIDDLLAEIDDFLRIASTPATAVENHQAEAPPLPIFEQPKVDHDIETTNKVTPQAINPKLVSGSDYIRVSTEVLDSLSNFAGEINISHDRVSQQNNAIRQQLSEMESTVERLKGQLRQLEMETEAQILFRYEDTTSEDKSDFDPLELDRFSQIQQLSRSLTESVTDLDDIGDSIENLIRDTDGLLLQQSRVNNDIQQGLMNTRLLPFSGLIPRFERIVRQMSAELVKPTELLINGSEQELDRTILEQVVAPLEHLIRNAMIHGIEERATRLAVGKNKTAQLVLSIERDGAEVVITLSDDGSGIDTDKVRQRALVKQLIEPNEMPDDDALVKLILQSGFSTADEVSQLAGRGVGMDVVNSAINALKGRLSIQTIAGEGTQVTLRLPMVLSTLQGLIIECAGQQYVVPLTSVQAGERISAVEAKAILARGENAQYQLGGITYRFMALTGLLGQTIELQENYDGKLPLLLFNADDLQLALVVDQIYHSREIVLKSIGEQLDSISAISGATILADGNVVFILDIPALIDSFDRDRLANSENSADINTVSIKARLPVALIIDDSITMRKASGNLLTRHGFEVMTARDGIDAIALINERIPDIILLDIEMPRMDGFEFAKLVRNDPHLRATPIVMITSRTGDKHRERAREVGVNTYLGKPYQEAELTQSMQFLLGDKYPSHQQEAK